MFIRVYYIYLRNNRANENDDEINKIENIFL